MAINNVIIIIPTWLFMSVMESRRRVSGYPTEGPNAERPGWARRAFTPFPATLAVMAAMESEWKLRLI